MLPFHPILLFLTPVLFVGIVVRACLQRVITCSCRAVLKHLGVHVHLFFCQLLPPPDYLYPGPIHLLGQRLVATVLQALLHTNNSGAAAEPAHDQRQGIAKSSKFPGMKCYEAEEAPGPDTTQGKASPAQPQQPWAPLRRYIISCPQLSLGRASLLWAQPLEVPTMRLTALNLWRFLFCGSHFRLIHFFIYPRHPTDYCHK